MQLQKNLFQFRARLQPQQSLPAKCMNVARKMTSVTHPSKAIAFAAVLLFSLLSFISFAQTTIQTTTYTGNGTGSGSPGTGISVNVINTNPYDVVLTNFGYSCGSAVQTQLWYSSTSITGSCGSIASPTWNQIATVNSPTTVANTVITDNFFTGLSLIIPANTNYRFVVVAVGGTARYSAASAPSPTTWTAGGVTLDATTSYWGGSGSVGNTGRYFYGSITFIPSCVGVTNLNTSNITVNSVTASWTGVSGSVGYEYALTSTPTPPPSSGTTTLATTANFSGLSLNTTYYIHVRNRCTSGPSNWSTTSFTTLNAYCLPPSNILFSNITMISADILWSLMPTADYYQYLISEIYTTNPNPILATTTTGITASATSLQPYTKYYAYVRSFCLGGNDSSWWKIDSFVTKSSCGTPNPQIIVPGNDPQVEWNPITDAISYEYRLTGSTNPPAFGTATTFTNVTVNLPNDGTNQYLHVRSKCNSQFTFSEWAMVALRETNTNSINDIDHSGTIVSAYPNPVNEWLTVEINSSNPAAATLILTDVTGSIVKTQAVTGKKMTMNMQGIASGVYLLKYSSTTHTEVLRVNKL
jgi:hypothetical protein